MNIKYINNFEKTVAELAIENQYDFVICGHIHQPNIQTYTGPKGKAVYLNSGDWVEHFTALEYQFKRWKLYHYSKDKLLPFVVDEDFKDMETKDLIAAITIMEQPKDIQ